METKSERTGAGSMASLGVLAFGVITTAAGAAVSIDPSFSVILISSIAWGGALAFGYLWMRRWAALSQQPGIDSADAFERVAGAATRLASESESLAQGVSSEPAFRSPAAGSAPDRTAAGLLGEVRQLADQSVEGLESLACPSGGSDAASAQIFAMGQVVEDIVFQTNLLALSAAVEAARPIDVSDGVAGVSGEVRVLARRCATASRRIADLARESGSEARADESEVVEPGRR